MTYKEKFENIENYLSACAEKWLLDIKRDGYKVWNEPSNKHIDILTYPEIHMNDLMKKEKEKAIRHIESLKEKVNKKGVITPIEEHYWNMLEDTEIPWWRWEYNWKN